MEEKVRMEIEGVKSEVKKSVMKIGEIEQKTKKIEKEMLENNKTLQERILMLDCKMLELHLCFRGIPEEQGDIRQQMIILIVDLVQRPPEEIDKNCYGIYRVNSEFARQKNIPRDVIVKVTTRKLIDEILDKQFKEPLHNKGKVIRILKELPKDVLQMRRNYRKITERLSSEHNRYRWQIPEGLSFIWKGKRVLIKSVDQMKEFLKQEGKKQGDEQETQNGY